MTPAQWYVVVHSLMMATITVAVWLGEKFVLQIQPTWVSAWWTGIGIYAVDIFLFTTLKHHAFLIIFSILTINCASYFSLLKLFAHIKTSVARTVLSYVASTFAFIVMIIINFAIIITLAS